MIVDKLSNAKLYYGLGERIEKAFKYLEETDLAKLEVGKFEVEGKNIYVMVSEYETRKLEAGKWEAHKNYLDIQCMISGKEKMGYANISAMKIKVEYNVEKDIVFLDGEGDHVTINEGMFALFAPEDAHMPNIMAKEQQNVKKIVVKILIP